MALVIFHFVEVDGSAAGLEHGQHGILLHPQSSVVELAHAMCVPGRASGGGASERTSVERDRERERLCVLVVGRKDYLPSSFVRTDRSRSFFLFTNQYQKRPYR